MSVRVNPPSMTRRMAALMCDELVSFLDTVANGGVATDAMERHAEVLRVLMLEGLDQVKFTYKINSEDPDLPVALVYMHAPCWSEPQYIFGSDESEAYDTYVWYKYLLEGFFVEYHREQFEQQFGLPNSLALDGEGEYRHKVARDAFAAFLESKRDTSI